MTRTLRGAWSRRGTLTPLFLLTAVVVGGVVTTIGFAEQADTSPLLAVPLLMLGAVAVPTTGRELASARRSEIAISRLRGIEGARLYAVLAVEPLLVLVAGALVGTGLGAVGAWVAARTWVDTASAAVSGTALLAAAAVAAVGLVAVLAGMSAALREPLADQVSIAERPRRATTGAVFGSVLLLVAAVVATYRASVVSPEDPDLVVLAGPALVGLAAGQVAVWLIRGAARLAVRSTAERSLPGFLAVRRLARVAEAATPIRVLVAASVVAALALTGATEVDDWAGDTARLRAGAPVQVPIDDDAVGALDLTRRLDPQGQWLMAAVLVPGLGSLPARRVFLDTARYDAVVGDFLADTPAAGVADRVADLAGGAPTVGTGDTVRVTARGVSSRLAGEIRPRVSVVYLDGHGRSHTVDLRLRLGLDGATATAVRPLRGCAGGCTVDGLTLGRTRGDAALPWVLTGLDLGGMDALARPWRAGVRRMPAGVIPVGIVGVDDGLLVPVADQALEAVPVGGLARLPVLVTDSTRWDGAPQVDSPGGDERPARVIDRLTALPLVEADGLLADLPSAAAGAPPTVPGAEVMVLAAADTPSSVLASLTDAAGHRPRTLDQVKEATVAESGAVQARVYSLMALFCLAVALLVLAAAASRRRPAQRHEVAALRILGVAPAQLRGSGRVELVLLAVAAVAAATVGGVLAVRLLLGHLALVDVPEHAVPLHAGVNAVTTALTAVVVAAVVLVVIGRSRSLRLDQSRPAILREEGTA